MIVKDLTGRLLSGFQPSFNLDGNFFYWKPIFIVLMQGRLGNLMFEYAILLRLRKNYPQYRGYLYRDKGLSDKTGYPSDLITPFNIPLSDFASEELIDNIKKLPISFISYITEKSLSNIQQISLKGSLVTFCVGYWQSESYFEDVKHLIRNTFCFNEIKLNQKTKQLAKKILSECAIGIHIRRGDYIESQNVVMYGHICTYKYYIRALKIITDKVIDNYFIYFFTDDPEWVKAHNPFPNSLVVDWNRKEEFWQDIYLMSLCHHNIIANSSFSWWGAWLNAHEDKIVVAPYRCFNTLWTPNMHPKEWFTIFSKHEFENEFVKQIEKNEIVINYDGLFHGKMGVVVFLFHYSQVNHDSFCEFIAIELVSQVFQSLNSKFSLDYANGLTGIATTIEYLCINKLVNQNSNKALLDVDDFFDDLIINSNLGIKLQDGLLGLIRYFRFRYMGQQQENKGYRINFENQLECLLDMLQIEQEYSTFYCDEIILELYELNLLNISQSHIKKIFSLIYPDLLNDYSVILKHASNVFRKRIDNIMFDNSPGLKGESGKELKLLSPNSNVHWTKLL